MYNNLKVYNRKNKVHQKMFLRGKKAIAPRGFLRRLYNFKKFELEMADYNYELRRYPINKRTKNALRRAKYYLRKKKFKIKLEKS